MAETPYANHPTYELALQIYDQSGAEQRLPPASELADEFDQGRHSVLAALYLLAAENKIAREPHGYVKRAPHDNDPPFPEPVRAIQTLVRAIKSGQINQQFLGETYEQLENRYGFRQSSLNVAVPLTKPGARWGTGARIEASEFTFEANPRKRKASIRADAERIIATHNSGDHFPLFDAIAARCDVSKKTVCQALSSLADQGLVLTHRNNNIGVIVAHLDDPARQLQIAERAAKHTPATPKPRSRVRVDRQEAIRIVREFVMATEVGEPIPGTRGLAAMIESGLGLPPGSVLNYYAEHARADLATSGQIRRTNDRQPRWVVASHTEQRPTPTGVSTGTKSALARTTLERQAENGAVPAVPQLAAHLGMSGMTLYSASRVAQLVGVLELEINNFGTYRASVNSDPGLHGEHLAAFTVAKSYLDRIRDRTLDPDDLFPSVPKVAAKFGVSIAAASQALHALGELGCGAQYRSDYVLGAEEIQREGLLVPTTGVTTRDVARQLAALAEQVPKGTKLPRRGELARVLQVSPSVVQAAFADMAKDKDPPYAIRSGAGTFTRHGQPTGIVKKFPPQPAALPSARELITRRNRASRPRY